MEHEGIYVKQGFFCKPRGPFVQEVRLGDGHRCACPNMFLMLPLWLTSCATIDVEEDQMMRRLPTESLC